MKYFAKYDRHEEDHRMKTLDSSEGLYFMDGIYPETGGSNKVD